MINLLEKLSEVFEITSDSAANNSLTYIGMEIKYDAIGIFVSQPQYVQKILKRFNYDQVYHVDTPMERGMVTLE